VIRALFIAAVAATVLGACGGNADYSRGTEYRHGGTGPSFNTRILP
jgi:hypothetical protein